MPVIFGTLVTAVVYDDTALTIAITGEAFGINEYAGTSNIEYKLSSDVGWSDVLSIDSWSDTQVVGSIAGKLLGGVYDVRVTSSDGEVSAAFESAITIASGGLFFFFGDGK